MTFKSAFCLSCKGLLVYVTKSLMKLIANQNVKSLFQGHDK